jgi:hypothetical protein
VRVARAAVHDDHPDDRPRRHTRAPSVRRPDAPPCHLPARLCTAPRVRRESRPLPARLGLLSAPTGSATSASPPSDLQQLQAGAKASSVRGLLQEARRLLQLANGIVGAAVLDGSCSYTGFILQPDEVALLGVVGAGGWAERDRTIAADFDGPSSPVATSPRPAVTPVPGHTRRTPVRGLSLSDQRRPTPADLSPSDRPAHSAVRAASGASAAACGHGSSATSSSAVRRAEVPVGAKRSPGNIAPTPGRADECADDSARRVLSGCAGRGGGCAALGSAIREGGRRSLSDQFGSTAAKRVG